MWKYHDFSIAQILREINFWDSTVSKFWISIFMISLQFLKVKIYQINKIQSH